MKKILLVPLASIALFAADSNLYNYAIEATGGYAINSSKTKLDNELSWGLRYHYNRSTIEGSIDIDAVQLAFDYSANNVYQNESKSIFDGKTNIYRLGTNAVWYIENDSDFTPYALLGLGVQFFNESEAKDTNNVLFGTIGAGVEYQLRGDFSAVAEVKGMFDRDGRNYVLGNIGIKYSFGQNY